MAKDPAFLFYYQDFLVGSLFLTNEEAGAYIRILSHLADKGTMSEKHMIKICKTKNVWEAIKDKFVEESDGNYYNKRLRLEAQKRKEYAESRRNNRLGKTKTEITYVNHMEDEDVNINKDINKDKMLKLWISTFGKNPSIPEMDETQKLLDKFGYNKTYKIMYQANLDGFKKIKTLIDALDKDGNIRPKETGDFSKDYTYNEMMAHCQRTGLKQNAFDFIEKDKWRLKK